MRIKAGELTLNVADTGAGEPTLIFLHYWGGSAQTWRAVTSRLSGHFRCVAYDQRGWGTSDAPADGYSIGNLADDATLLIRALKVDRYLLIGHSMGGKVVQLLASR
jgi:pimeloyl-ACP methyl ester carboxylesterase